MEETIEIEIDSELLHTVTLAASEQGLTAEQYISGIVEAWAKEETYAV